LWLIFRKSYSERTSRLSREEYNSALVFRGELQLVSRAAALAGRWEETMEKVQQAMASDRRRDWQWEAADIVAEFNSGVPIKPPTPQPQSSERNETIAA
jgi:hypothetical protein